MPTFTLIRRHIVPNLLGVVAVYVTLTIPQVILVESFLSFLGLGVQEPMTSWGALVNEGSEELESSRGCWCFRPRFWRRRCFVLILLAMDCAMRSIRRTVSRMLACDFVRRSAVGRCHSGVLHIPARRALAIAPPGMCQTPHARHRRCSRQNTARPATLRAPAPHRIKRLVGGLCRMCPAGR